MGRGRSPAGSGAVPDPRRAIGPSQQLKQNCAGPPAAPTLGLAAQPLHLCQLPRLQRLGLALQAGTLLSLLNLWGQAGGGARGWWAASPVVVGHADGEAGRLAESMRWLRTLTLRSISDTRRCSRRSSDRL